MGASPSAKLISSNYLCLTATGDLESQLEKGAIKIRNNPFDEAANYRFRPLLSLRLKPAGGSH
jgi:hypothetical protein